MKARTADVRRNCCGEKKKASGKLFSRVQKAVRAGLPELGERQSETDFWFGANIPPYKANLFDAIRSHFQRGVNKP